jgi:hypothetical protein
MNVVVALLLSWSLLRIRRFRWLCLSSTWNGHFDVLVLSSSGNRNLNVGCVRGVYLPFNVSHCWSPLLFVWAVPSLPKGSSIIVPLLVPVSARPFWIAFLSRTSTIISVVCFWLLGGSLFFASTAVKGSHCRYYCFCDSFACSRSTVPYCRYCPCRPRYCSLPCRSFHGLSGHLALS